MTAGPRAVGSGGPPLLSMCVFRRHLTRCPSRRPDTPSILASERSQTRDFSLSRPRWCVFGKPGVTRAMLPRKRTGRRGTRRLRIPRCSFACELQWRVILPHLPPLFWNNRSRTVDCCPPTRTCVYRARNWGRPVETGSPPPPRPPLLPFAPPTGRAVCFLLAFLPCQGPTGTTVGSSRVPVSI